MSITRRFLIAPSLARLLRRDRGGSRVTEGHFPNQAGRSSHVHLDGETSSLVLVTMGADGGPVEERTDVPRAHAEALLDVAPGKVDYARTRLNANGREVWVDRFVTPGPMDLIQVAFENQEEASRFTPAPWFGPEVTNDAAYHTRSIALQTLPQVPDVPLSNVALDTLLDALENRFSAPRAFAPQPARRPAEDPLRRMTSTFGDAAPRSKEAQGGPAQPAPEPAQPSPTPGPGAPSPAPAAPPGPAVPPALVTGTGPTPAGPSDADLDIEDDVIRELARSLRPPGRGA